MDMEGGPWPIIAFTRLWETLLICALHYGWLCQHETAWDSQETYKYWLGSTTIGAAVILLSIPVLSKGLETDLL